MKQLIILSKHQLNYQTKTIKINPLKSKPMKENLPINS